MQNKYYSLKNIENAFANRIDWDTTIRTAEECTPFHKNATYKIEALMVNKILPLCKYIVKDRLAFVRKLRSRYEDCGAGLFEPLKLTFPGGVYQIVPPPVVELRDGMHILCDGMHRVHLAKEMGIDAIFVLIVGGVQIPLPGSVNSWDSVRLVSHQPVLADNFINFVPEGMTGYSFIFNSEKLWVD